jgi:hypothetical protein
VVRTGEEWDDDFDMGLGSSVEGLVVVWSLGVMGVEGGS